MDGETRTRILQAVDDRFDRQTDFLAELTAHASTRGQEQSAQALMAGAMTERGYTVDRWAIDVAAIHDLPGFSPVKGDYDDAINVVGTHRSRSRKGRSLILNGHVDVVPAGPLDMWDTPPFEPKVADGWMTGRGAGDMKAGLVANLFALDALAAIGAAPAADVHVQSVVEEECTGNGALACLQRGYRADAVLIPEPFSEELVTAQVGVIWFQLVLKGRPAHVAYAGSGANAIEQMIPLIDALHGLEERWNAPDRRHADFADHDHALNLNIGRIEGGDWTSAVPSWCVVDVRMGTFPGQDMPAARAEIEETVAAACAAHPQLRQSPARVVYHGFMAQGYALSQDGSETATAAVATLEGAHRMVNDRPLARSAITCTTDSRFFGLYADTPALVYGPKAEAIHAFNERVDLDSARRITQATALFVADWCGLESAEKGA